MATLRLVNAIAVGPNFLPNTVAEFRFDTYSMATLTFSQPNVWVNFPPSATLNFATPGNILLYMQGMLTGTSPTTINGTPLTNAQCIVACASGPFIVTYNVL